MLRLLAILAIALPSAALAAGPAVISSPDLRLVPTGPAVIGGDSDALLCLLENNPNCAAATGSTPITTTRPSPVPCEVGGAWTTVGANTACIGPRGLESWPQCTNYVTQSTDFATWSTSTATLTSNGDGSWQVCYPSGATGNRGIFSATLLTAVAGDRLSMGVDVRPVSGIASFALKACGSGGGCDCTVAPSGAGWQRLSCTATHDGTTAARFYVYANASAGGCFDIRQAQYEKSPTPGRRCDAGATATTCQADAPAVSALGFPGENVVARMRITLGSPVTTARAIWGRGPGGGSGTLLQITATGTLMLYGPTWGTVESGTLTWTPDTPYWIEVRRIGGVVSLWRNGTKLIESAKNAIPWPAVLPLAVDYNGTAQLGGSISNFSVGEP